LINDDLKSYFFMKNRNSILLRYVLILAVSLVLTSCKKPDNPSPPPPSPAVNPDLSIQNASQERTSREAVMRFYLYINKATTKDVSVNYTTVDGTAVSPNNYKKASGTVTIPAGKTQAQINVVIKGDSLDLRQPNIQFTIKLSNPKNCNLSSDSAVGTIITENGSYLPTDSSGYITPKSYPGYKLVWDNEFSSHQLNTNYWTAEKGNGNGGWGNNELEYYRNSPHNVFVSDGNLIIEARQESYGGYDYTSARIKTQDKFSFQYGRVDIRAKLPKGKGIWPALWMLGSNINSAGWPACGEIDIMELIGSQPATVYGTLHWASKSGSNDQKGAPYKLSYGDFSQQFHVFSMLWKQDTVELFVDDNHYLTVTKTDVGTANYPFNSNQFFIFNVAVGGNWPGSPDATTKFPQRMFVDYVRVFQQAKK
jgi:beta-glucanase (GH16 family)